MLTIREVVVPKASGPTIARWQLGSQLKHAREAVGMTQKQIGEVLGCSESKIYKIEAGDVSVGRGDLLVMLDQFKITDGDERETALDLQKQGKQRGWWAKYGALPTTYANYVGLEEAAIEIKSFELGVIPGLLQTEDYARVAMTSVWPDEPNEVQRRVELRMARQAALTKEPPLKFWAIVDEGVLRRSTGGAEVMRAQLRHLIEMDKRPNISIQVVPFSEGWHAGTAGSFHILEFPEKVRSPIAYIVSQAGEVYLEREDDMRRVTLNFSHLQSAALSRSKSRELIAAIAKELA